jgi:type IX secretion system PorP/SprF family membrane protein
MNKKKFIYLFLALLSFAEGNAQQDALYSQYMFNPFMINPAYAGSRNATSAVLLFREQWLGIDGAPSTQTFSIHSPFAKNKMALGLNISNDAIGPTRNTGGFLTYAYHLKMPKGKLSMGLRGGMYNSRLDQSLLNYQDQTDHFIGTSTTNALSPSFDFGLYYYTNKFYAGLSSTHLSQNKFIYEGVPEGANFVLKRHYMLATGFAWEMSKNAVLKPSLLILPQCRFVCLHHRIQYSRVHAYRLFV